MRRTDLGGDVILLRLAGGWDAGEGWESEGETDVICSPLPVKNIANAAWDETESLTGVFARNRIIKSSMRTGEGAKWLRGVKFHTSSNCWNDTLFWFAKHIGFFIKFFWQDIYSHVWFFPIAKHVSNNNFPTTEKTNLKQKLYIGIHRSHNAVTSSLHIQENHTTMNHCHIHLISLWNYLSLEETMARYKAKIESSPPYLFCFIPMALRFLRTSPS